MGAGFLLLEALKIPDDGALRYHEYGKPYAPGFPCFNLSHSGSWCVLAVSETEIGIDIEEIRGEHLQITRAVLTPEETDWMRQDPLIRFHRLWTWKESVMKATGLGLNLDPKEIDVLPFTRGEPVRTASGQWYALDEQIDNCRLSICTLRPMKHIRRMELLADGQRAVPAPE